MRNKPRTKHLTKRTYGLATDSRRYRAKTIALYQHNFYKEVCMIWKPIKGYEGYYEVSDHGDVRSLDRDIVG